jgi:multiple sugar transport system ATP-binding protein
LRYWDIPMPDISLERVSKHFPGGVMAVDGLTLTVRDGELLVLVGPSGCGKTTTLRLIAGLEMPTQGVLRIGGIDARTLPPRARDVALVFQRPTVYPHLNVKQNLAFGLQLRRGGGPLRRLLSRLRPAPEAEERVREVAGLLGLREVLGRRADQLSVGQQQRVALGRALVRRPGILLLDEPLASLDAPLRLELRRELHLLHRRFPATMVYVTHDPLEAMSLGDRVAVLDRGAVQQAGTPEEVYRRPVNRFVAGFFRRAPTNFFDGCLVLEDGGLTFRTADWHLPVPAAMAYRWRHLTGRDLTLGLRAENVEVLPSRSRPGNPDDLEAQALLVEPLGQGWLVTVTAPGQAGPKLVAYFGCQRPGPVDKIEEGRRVWVRLHLDRAHLFDRTTGVALGDNPAGR